MTEPAPKSSRVRKHVYCGNCGAYGHLFKKCPEPIISIGIIAFHISEACLDPADSLRLIAPFCSEQHELSDFFLQNKPQQRPVNINDECVKFLMIRRKNTLGYMEFMRGRYQVGKRESIVKLLELMVAEEMAQLVARDFDDLWESLWLNKSKHNQHEYKVSKHKFAQLKESGLLEQLCADTTPLYSYPEWGFPKGRRNMQEKNLSCGLREFTEETGYSRADIQVLDKIGTTEESFRGTNNIPYKHIYFTSHCMFSKDLVVADTNYEIGDMGWFTLQEALSRIRERHRERKVILEDLHSHIMALLHRDARRATDLRARRTP